jgi:hypothetical protein
VKQSCQGKTHASGEIFPAKLCLAEMPAVSILQDKAVTSQESNSLSNRRTSKGFTATNLNLR